MNPAAGQQSAAPGVPPEAQRLIRSEQERAYRNLALKLGLGADPQKAYERLSGTPLARTSHSPYEDPNRYQIMEMVLGSLQRAMAHSGASPLDPAPAFATLPSGNVSAQVVIEPKTLTPVIFFEQGLFHFFFDFCHLIGWAVPPISERQLANDDALTDMVHRYTMPFQASESFVTSIGSYTFEGSPMVNGIRVPRPEHNMLVCRALLTLMERFVMAHEVAHIKFGHLLNSPGRNEEFQADAASLGLLTYMTGDGVVWSLAYWACELALVALNLLYRAIELAEFGGKKVTWIDNSHPDPITRRDALRQIWLEPSVPGKRPGEQATGVSAARELCGMSDALVQRLWEFATVALALSHQHGARPSPMWRALIDNTFAVKN
jgi:hypothetical protein